MDNIIYWRRKWQPSPGFFPGESHGQRSLMGYSPWGSKESDVTETNNTPCPWNFTGICATSGLIQILLVKMCFVANDKKKKKETEVKKSCVNEKGKLFIHITRKVKD